NGSGIAPQKANISFFEDRGIDKISTTSPHSVTIPGAVHAWHKMHQKFGSLEFEELFLTAENYARNGFPVHEVVAKSWLENKEKLKTYPITNSIFLKNNKPYFFGEIHKNTDLADTLKSIAKNGIKDFYQGYVAEDIVSSLNAIGGLHSMDDFAKQDTIFSDSLSNTYRNIRLHQCPPNGPGITVLMMMGLLEKFDFTKIIPLSADRFHLQAEATKIAFEQREDNIGDPKFNDFDFHQLIQAEYINELASKISMDKI
ncbi:uncharacterized protein METZ01_LOCUS448503, partial [marine metagenome]